MMTMKKMIGMLMLVGMLAAGASDADAQISRAEFFRRLRQQRAGQRVAPLQARLLTPSTAPGGTIVIQLGQPVRARTISVVLEQIDGPVFARQRVFLPLSLRGTAIFARLPRNPRLSRHLFRVKVTALPLGATIQFQTAIAGAVAVR